MVLPAGKLAMRQAAHAVLLVLLDYPAAFRGDIDDRIVRRLERFGIALGEPCLGTLVIGRCDPEVLAANTHVELRRVHARLDPTIRYLSVGTVYQFVPEFGFDRRI